MDTERPAAPRRPRSLVWRLTALIAVAAALVFAAFGWFVRQSIEQHFEEQDFGELHVVALAVRRALEGVKTERDLGALASRLGDSLAGHHGVHLYVARADGHTIFATPGTDFSAIAHQASDSRDVDRGALRIWRDAGHTYRGIALRAGEAPGDGRHRYTVTVAMAIDYHLRYLKHFNLTLSAMVAGGIAIMILMGWIAVRQGHAPLRRIVAQVHRISSNHLHTRIAPDTVPEELSELALSFNEMLDRIEEAFRRLSNFSADIAHELRTPVTNLMTQTQVALAGARSGDEYREVLYSSLEEYERMAQMIGDMLFLAQADNEAMLPRCERVDLAAEVRALFDYFEAWAEERAVSLEIDGAADALCDREMMRRALTNLLSNAIRHTAAGGTVRVELRARAGTTRVSVENPGPEIPAEHLPRLFDRFYRADRSRRRGVDGAGLGLAIVKSIVAAHGGQVAAVSTGQRTRFEIALPDAAGVPSEGKP